MTCSPPRRSPPTTSARRSRRWCTTARARTGSAPAAPAPRTSGTRRRSLAVAHLAVLAGKVAVRRAVLHPQRDGGWAAGLTGSASPNSTSARASRHLLAAEPCLQMAPHLVGPGHGRRGTRCSPPRRCSGWPPRPRSTSSSCSPGRSIDSRSKPSDSHSAVVPTTSHGRVGRAAAATASAIGSAPVSGREPTLHAAKQHREQAPCCRLDDIDGAAGGELDSSWWSPCRHARGSSVPCGGGLVMPSSTTSPSTSTRARPACTRLSS